MKERVLACVAASAAVAGVASADVSFAFTWGQASVDVLAGTTVAVPLFLTETVTGDSTSILADENGLSSVGVSVVRQNAGDPIPTSPAFMTLAGLALNAIEFFDDTDPIFGPTLFVSPLGDLAQALVFARDAGVVGTMVEAGVHRVLIGTITFSAGTVDGETTVFSSGDYDLNSSDTITWENFQILDSQIARSQIRINTIVPAPGWVAGLAMAGVLFARRRR